MKKKRIITILIISSFIITVLFFNAIQVSAQENNVYLDFFYTEGCPACEEKKPLIDSVESIYYQRITVRRFLMDDMPVVLILAKDDYTFISWENFSEENISSAIDNYMDLYQNNIVIEFHYFSGNNNYGGWIEKKEIVDDILDNYPERLILHIYELKTSVPIVVIKNQNYTQYNRYEHDEITRSSLINIIEEYTQITQTNNDTNNISDKNDKKNDFFIPGFEIIQFLAFLLIFFITYKKRFKRK